MKTFAVKLIMMAALLALPIVAHAQLEEVITGSATDVARGSLTQALGDTVITPYVTLNSWSMYWTVSSPAGGRSFMLREEVKFSPLTQSYSAFGHVVYTNPAYDPGPQNSAPDLPGSPVLQDYQCNVPLGFTNGFGQPAWHMETEKQTCTFYLWVDAVQSGLNPPGPPYNVTLSSSMQGVEANCLVGAVAGTWPVKQRYGVPYPGHVVVELGHSSYVFAWPFAIWVGNTYDRD